MEKVRPWYGQPSDRGQLKNRTKHLTQRIMSPQTGDRIVTIDSSCDVTSSYAYSDFVLFGFRLNVSTGHFAAVDRICRAISWS